VDLLLTWREDMGDGTLRLHFQTPGGNTGTVVVGHDVLASGAAYDVMAVAAGRIDADARALDTIAGTEGQAP
jgi:hypothetical protein